MSTEPHGNRTAATVLAALGLLLTLHVSVTLALQYLAAKRENRMLPVVGPIFRPYKIAMAVREGSPLRKRINN